ncbi:Asparagine--tRNA ligase [uncultured Ruminococcus sp.]|uniref:asparagine--tRNA ligase n=1 Tax=Massiliimalia timonensis TaxID=1987501 RepID=UPI0008204359|nr:asparagine--tRNA ligase [Massiliimalia timonensis]SCH54091.1 Asparagine--tRNA ligase [uncultured Clostridium sp.]SCH64835.1 Asparagine--tRNA ligase [uncultured Ruminococcus sp.]
MARVEIKTLFDDVSAYQEQKVTVSGWVKTIRDSKALGFMELNDGSCFKNLQIVFEDNRIDNFKEVTKFNVGSAVTVTGDLVLTPQAKQPFEIHADSVVLEGASSNDYPLQKKRHSMEFLRSIAHLRPRANTFSAVFRVRSVAAFAIHKFFNERGFVYAHTPLITGSDCEGAGEMFRVTTLDAKNPPLCEDGSVDYAQDFFGKPTSLTVSGQLEAECMAMAFGKVYTFGPTFRAENSNTTRHAAEFWMIEPEIAFADLAQDMELARDMVKYVLAYVLEQCPDEMQFFNNFFDKGLIERLKALVDSEFAHVTYTEAIEILEQHKEQFDYPVYWGCDLQSEHERYLTEQVFKCPVFVTDYPKEIKAFYMRLNDDGKTVAAMDMLVPGIGELIGGSQREERLEVLEARIRELGMDPEDYSWYLDLRRFGGTKHAGFGLGFERMIMYITGVSNIRDVLPFPRTTGTAEY